MINFKIKKSIAAAVSIICLTASLSSCASSSTDPETSAETTTTIEDTSSYELTLPSKADDSSDDSSDESKPDHDTSDIPYTPAAWKVTSPSGNTMYMMGSMHALKQECTPLPDYVIDMYESSDELAVEVDITDTTAQVSLLLNYTDKMTYPDGETVEQHLGKELWADISSYLEAYDMNPDDYLQYQAWYIDMLLENIPLPDADLSANYGLDMQLLLKAKEDHKEIYEVESMEFQMDLLSGYSEDVMKTMLSGYKAENKELIIEQLHDLYKSWKSGDLEAFENSDEESLSEYTEEEKKQIEEFNKKLVTDRNVGMAEKAMELIDGDKKVFYVVGLAHFTGDDGILKLLEDKGCTVERIEP